MRHGVLQGGTVDLHFVETGSGPLILLLHGFPEFWYGWRRQLPALAADGFRAVAPDLRGYNRSGRPRGIGEYRLETLVEDVSGLVERLGEREAVLVGHDWGGIIAWYTAMHAPSVVRRLIILNAPHPAAFRRELRSLSSQLWRSWYAGVFQLPYLPEAVLRAGDCALLRRSLRGAPAENPEELESYVAAFRPPGALTGPINYYRALARYGPPPTRSIGVPTLLIWGERDPFLVPRLTEGLDRWVPNLRVERLREASHWLHHEQPQRIASLIAEFARAD